MQSETDGTWKLYYNMGSGCGKLGASFTGVTLSYSERVKLAFAFLLLAALVFAAADIAVIQPADLAAQLAKNPKPTILYVGPNLLYRSKHIPGAVFAGPGNRPEGLNLLRAAAKDLPRDRQVVIYCGCCPWDHCPNIHPAFETLRQMGFKNVKAMYSPIGFKQDWIDRGYPVE
jgi:thiosulfate/3-mercaptopyruvate sulfurtransferase